MLAAGAMSDEQLAMMQSSSGELSAALSGDKAALPLETAYQQTSGTRDSMPHRSAMQAVAQAEAAGMRSQSSMPQPRHAAAGGLPPNLYSMPPAQRSANEQQELQMQALPLGTATFNRPAPPAQHHQQFDGHLQQHQQQHCHQQLQQTAFFNANEQLCEVNSALASVPDLEKQGATLLAARGTGGS